MRVKSTALYNGDRRGCKKGKSKNENVQDWKMENERYTLQGCNNNNRRRKTPKMARHRMVGERIVKKVFSVRLPRKKRRGRTKKK